MDYNNLPKSFCILPWIHSAINPDGTVRQCCVSQPWSATVGSLSNNTLEEIFNDAPLRELRKQLLTGERLPESCLSCRLREDADTKVFSYRQGTNAKYRDVIETLQPDPDGYAEFQQLYIDYRFSNKCNFKCVSCGPSLSSSIGQERIKVEQLKNPHVDPARIKQSMPPAFIEVDTQKFYKEFLKFSTTIREIYFAGGEPLINDHHYELLEHFIETQQPVSIFYNTNFSELNYKGKNVIEMWRKINGPVNIYASIDGYGETGETIRDGFSTVVFEENVKKYISAKLTKVLPAVTVNKQHQIGFCITFGLTNYDKVIDTARWLLTMVHASMDANGIMPTKPSAELDNLYYPAINFNPIIEPAPMSVTFLNEEQRAQVVNKIEQQLLELRNDSQFSAVFGHDRLLQEIHDNFLGYIKRVELRPTINYQILSSTIEILDSAEELRESNWRKTLAPMYKIWSDALNNEGKQ